MTFRTAHPLNQTRFGWYFRTHASAPAYVPVMRRLFGLTVGRVHVDILRNRYQESRWYWDASYSLGTFTVAVVRRNG